MQSSDSREGKKIKQERKTHDKLYRKLAPENIQEPLTWERYRANQLVPPHRGGPIYGLDCQIFFDRINDILDQNENDVRILDYGCGLGELGILIARRGFKVDGFDVSPEAIKNARLWAKNSEVSNHVNFRVANAKQLPYEDEAFDLVFGKAVLHHTIKYDGTGDELWRVMKPGARALFLEGASTNPLIRLARTFTIKEELGDVPLTIKNIHEWGASFSDIDIDGYFLFYMLKRLGFQSYDDDLEKRCRNIFGKSKIYEYILHVLLYLDECMVNEKSYSDLISGRYVISVVK